MKNIALIFAGGVGSRMKSKSLPKQFLKVQGTPILIHTLRNFENHPDITDIIVVSLGEYIQYVWKLIDEYKITKVKDIVKGGNNGQESIYNGLCACEKLAYDNPIVLIHDGVRPLISMDLITNNLESVKIYGTAISCVPEKETIVLTEQNEIKHITEKSKTYVARAPQSFWLTDILKAHRKAICENKLNFIDSCTMMKEYNYPLHVVLTESTNIKITTPEDFFVFRALLELEENQQILG